MSKHNLTAAVLDLRCQPWYQISRNEVLILNRSLPRGKKNPGSNEVVTLDSCPQRITEHRYGDVTTSLTLSHCTHRSVKFLSKPSSLFPSPLLEVILSFLTLTDVRWEWTLINAVCMSATFPCTSSRMSSSEGYLLRFERILFLRLLKTRNFIWVTHKLLVLNSHSILEIIYQVNVQSVQ